MKILVLSQYYDPEPVPIPGQVARGLRARGHDVRVLTAVPSYPKGEIYDGYANERHVEELEGIPVHRVGTFASHSRSALGRFVSYASFAGSAARARDLICGSDVVYVYATQMTAAMPVDLWGQMSRTPFVLHVQDLWPESISESTMVPASARGLVDAVLSPWLTGVYRRSAAIVPIAPTMARTLVDRSGDEDKVHTLLNWSVEDGRTVQPRNFRRTSTGVNVLYAGNVGDLQGLDLVIDAVAKSENPKVRLRIVGAGSSLDEVRQRAAEMVLDGRVEFYDPVPRDRLGPHFDWADFQMIPLRNLEIFRGTVPSKLQGSLREGIPVITNVPGDVSAMVAQQGIGFVARPGDAEHLSEVLAQAAATDDYGYAQMSHQALEFYGEAMSEASALDRLEHILTDVASTRGE